MFNKYFKKDELYEKYTKSRILSKRTMTKFPPFLHLIIMFADVPIMYGTKLKYASIVVNTTMQTFSVSYFDGLPVRDAWENLVTSEVSEFTNRARKSRVNLS